VVRRLLQKAPGERFPRPDQPVRRLEAMERRETNEEWPSGPSSPATASSTSCDEVTKNDSCRSGWAGAQAGRRARGASLVAHRRPDLRAARWRRGEDRPERGRDAGAGRPCAWRPTPRAYRRWPPENRRAAPGRRVGAKPGRRQGCRRAERRTYGLLPGAAGRARVPRPTRPASRAIARGAAKHRKAPVGTFLRRSAARRSRPTRRCRTGRRQRKRRADRGSRGRVRRASDASAREVPHPPTGPALAAPGAEPEEPPAVGRRSGAVPRGRGGRPGTIVVAPSAHRRDEREPAGIRFPAGRPRRSQIEAI